MRLGWTTSKYSITYRAVKTVRIDGKNKTLILKSFGSEKHLCEIYGFTDSKAWVKEQVRLMNEAEKEDSARFSIELGLGKGKICCAISARHLFEYDLNDIFSRLIYTRILYPSSKKSSLEGSKKFIEPPVQK